jgi:hypothetical protein
MHDDCMEERPQELVNEILKVKDLPKAWKRKHAGTGP